MEISKAECVVHLSHKRCIERVLKRINMHKCIPVGTSLAPQFNLSELQMPHFKDEVENMSKVPYASAVGSIMYVTVSTHPKTTQSVSMVNRNMSNQGKRH